MDLKNCWRNIPRTGSSTFSSVSTRRSKNESSACSGGLDSDGWGIKVLVLLFRDYTAHFYVSGSCGDSGEHSNDNANAQGICSGVGIRMSLNRKDEGRQELVTGATRRRRGRARGKRIPTSCEYRAL